MERMETQGPPWKTIIKTIFWFVLVVVALINLPIVITAFNSVKVLGGLLLAAILLAAIITLIIWGVKKLRHKEMTFWRTLLPVSAFLFLISILIIATPVWGVFMINEFMPMTAPKVTMTNGEKTVIFQGMMHIGSADFYKSVVFNMLEAEDAGYTLFYEGIGYGSDENEARLDVLTSSGGQDVNDSYMQLADVCNLASQFDYIGVFDDKIDAGDPQHQMVDVTTDDLIQAWDELLKAHPEYAEMQSAPAEAPDTGMFRSALKAYEGLSNEQRDLVGETCQAFFNLVLGHAASQVEDDPFTKYMIMDYRNRHLANAIIHADTDKIYITYGNDHLAGIWHYLKENDPNWEIVDVQWRRTLASPEQLSGSLNLQYNYDIDQ